MRLTRLIVLIMALITSAGFFMLYSYLTEDLENQTFQATEEALIDTAYILASLVENEALLPDDLNSSIHHAHSKEFVANVHTLTKVRIGTHLYITDSNGIVTYDSDEEQRVGKDYSQFNDVYLARLDKYGARSSRVDESDPNSSILYVGVPLKKNSEIVGTLTVYKKQSDIATFITSRKRWITLSITMIALGMIVFTISVFAWIFRPIGKLTNYANSITRGERQAMPHLGRGREVNTLGNALKEMRETLDGRSYIENYTQILTHELKSPLAAIRGASELLTEEMPIDQRSKFITNIHNETLRSQRIIDGLLKLAQLEAQPQLMQKEAICVLEICQELKIEHHERLSNKSIDFQINGDAETYIQGEASMLKAAIANLLENAIHFSPDHSVITCSIQNNGSQTLIAMKDEGTGVPDYAINRVFERFYSLAKPGSHQKSSGLGLAFVKEIIELHEGAILIENNEDIGATVSITLPSS